MEGDCLLFVLTIHTYILTYIQTYIQPYIHTYIQPYIQPYIHIYIQLQTAAVCYMLLLKMIFNYCGCPI